MIRGLGGLGSSTRLIPAVLNFCLLFSGNSPVLYLKELSPWFISSLQNIPED